MSKKKNNNTGQPYITYGPSYQTGTFDPIVYDYSEFDETEEYLKEVNQGSDVIYYIEDEIINSHSLDIIMKQKNIKHIIIKNCVCITNESIEKDYDAYLDYYSSEVFYDSSPSEIKASKEYKRIMKKKKKEAFLNKCKD